MTRRLLLRAIAVAITAALVAWFVSDARWQGVGARLARIDPWVLVAVALLFATSYAMRAARIAGEFRNEIAGPQRYARVLRLTLVHNALVNVLPFRSGEAAFPMLLGRWFGVPTPRAIVSLLWLRAQDACVVLVLAALVWPDVPLAIRVVALLAIIGLACGVPAWARRHRAQVGASSSGRVAKLRALLERSTERGASGWAWTVGNWTVKLVAETWLVAVALGPINHDASIGTSALGAIGAELASILPVQGVAGFGTFEAGAAALMRTKDVPLDAGLEAALALHAVVLALSIAAGGLAAALLPGAPRAAVAG